MEEPEYFYGGYCDGRTPQFAVEQQGKTCDQFVVDDLLDFSNEEDSSLGRGDEVGLEIMQVNSADGSLIRAADSSSNSSGYDPHFSGDLGCRSFADAGLSDDLCALVQYDEVAELEWLSNFVEESFSSDDMQKLQFMSDLVKSPTSSSSHTRSGLSTAQGRCSSQASELLSLERHVPGKPRSRRSRLPPTSWSSRLLVLSPATSTTESHSWRAASARKKTPKAPKRDGVEGAATPAAVGRKCLHCASERTPQWRAGPMGPKTLCNACGVRYKSGRLVPEYRPAASPTFVLSEHSNSHRKVLLLRRQKEMLQQQQQQQRNRSGSPFMLSGEVYRRPDLSQFG